MKKTLPVCFFAIFLTLIPAVLIAQSYPPKREFRGVWVASVANIDWPSSQGLTPEEQRNEFKELVTFHKNNGLNALIVQVRPNADALYDSSYEPWSRWLTGKEGKAPEPYYDPLAFMIKECRQQGMEFHAWFNPYRAIFDFNKAEIDSVSHVFFDHPEWIVTYGKHAYLDPGIPGAREHVVNVIMDVVNRYEIDGVHFDDYFYPYKIDTLQFSDSTTFQRYNEGFGNIEDWRRNNINMLVKSVYDSIQSVKPHVKFGVSPFGVWRNQDVDPTGSDSKAGQTSYDDLYADVLTWLKNGWIDYVVPQIYFSIGYPPADYEKLLDWWSRNTYGRQLYIGQAAYKVNNNHDRSWLEPTQIGKQIDMNRRNFQVDGSIYFSARSFNKNPLGLADTLRRNHYRYPALIPQMSWLPKSELQPPLEVKAARDRHEVLVQWNEDIHQDVRYYIVYAEEGESEPNLSDSKTIIGRTYSPHLSFKEKGRGLFRKKHTIVVTAVDRQHQESIPSRPIRLKLHSLKD
ncbi:family 10 glycosylhydrolase [Porifericola rhodea]|uniref:glycoside hydrolase family 10 protein n=1 Tax=Porifericola rhodea TaxID=930972 RepID=UPI0026661936|nr:family 10 glycosylhydrolase [Porifericola rhodea]WKN31459.1 family 10 glycosylhydrolase [Porifericola rhodea]